MNLQPPVRASHTYAQTLKGRPGEVFPLLCPVREKDWVPGWNPRIVISASGVAERDCVFITPDGEHEAIWLVTEYEPDVRIEFVKITPGITAGRIRIELREHADGGTEALVTYQYTALSEKGRAFVDGFTEEAYAAFMRAWEDALNQHLEKFEGRSSKVEGGHAVV